MVTLKFNFYEKFTLLRNKLKKCRKTTKNEHIYDMGVSKINKELDIMCILKQLRKMQAVLDTIMEDTPVSLRKIQSKFVKSITIFTDSEEECQYHRSKNEFEQFMEQNENDFLNSLN